MMGYVVVMHNRLRDRVHKIMRRTNKEDDILKYKRETGKLIT